MCLSSRQIVLHLPSSVLVLNQSCTVLYPVAGVEVTHLTEFLHRRSMDVAANHTVAVLRAGVIGQSLFEIANELHDSFAAMLKFTAESTFV